MAGHECHITGMIGKTPKRPRDPNQLAKSIVDIATGDNSDSASSSLTPAQRKAQKAGRRGGAVRAERLTPERRKEIAKAAAIERWGKEDDRD
jgi:hypothetical protein